MQDVEDRRRSNVDEADEVGKLYLNIQRKMIDRYYSIYIMLFCYQVRDIGADGPSAPDNADEVGRM